MMFRQAAGRIDEQGASMAGLDAAALHRLLQERISVLETQGAAAAFVEFDLPLSDPDLQAACAAICRTHGYAWGLPSNMADRQLIHRHTLRDRSDVIAARAESAALKHERL